MWMILMYFMYVKIQGKLLSLPVLLFQKCLTQNRMALLAFQTEAAVSRTKLADGCVLCSCLCSPSSEPRTKGAHWFQPTGLHRTWPPAAFTSSPVTPNGPPDRSEHLLWEDQKGMWGLWGTLRRREHQGVGLGNYGVHLAC